MSKSRGMNGIWTTKPS